MGTRERGDLRPIWQAEDTATDMVVCPMGFEGCCCCWGVDCISCPVYEGPHPMVCLYWWPDLQLTEEHLWRDDDYCVLLLVERMS